MELAASARMRNWNISTSEAKQLQNSLACQVAETPLYGQVRLIAGVDVSIRGRFGRAAVVVLKLPELTVENSTAFEDAVNWPYVPGLLAFREIPLILRAWERLDLEPDVIMVDGHGRAHSRRFGLACHLGVLLQKPTLGVGKTRFVGQYDDPCVEKGCRTKLTDPRTGELLGAVVRTRTHVSPVFVSTGHAITLEESVSLVLRCAVRYRLPEPTRQAHLESRRWTPRHH